MSRIHIESHRPVYFRLTKVGNDHPNSTLRTSWIDDWIGSTQAQWSLNITLTLSIPDNQRSLISIDFSHLNRLDYFLALFSPIRNRHFLQ